MTPALPGEAPDPSATPRLDARLKEVEARRLMSRLPDLRQLTKSEARLAAMLRVAVEALGEQAQCECCDVHPGEAQEALDRLDAMAKGEE